MRRLALVTQRFPFPPGEEFLAAELRQLALAFDRVDLLPVDGIARSGQRSLPPNVRVGQLGLPARGRVRNALRGARLLADAQAREWFLSEAGAARGAGRKALARLALYLGEAVAIRDALAGLEAVSGPALLYSYWSGPAATAMAMLKERDPRRIAVSRAHGVDLYPEQSAPPYIPLQRRTACGLDRVFLVSRHGLDHLRRTAPQASLELRRLGVGPAARRSPSSSDGTLRIVSCCYVVPVKRMALLASALRSVKAPVEWTHIGGGPGLAALEAETATLPAHVRAHFLGSLENEAVLRWYEENPTDLFVSVSASEGLPVSVVEAASRGIPALATLAGGTGEIVDPSTGWTLPLDVSAESIARAIDAIAAAPGSDRASRRDGALSRARTLFDAETNHRAFAESLARLAAR